MNKLLALLIFVLIPTFCIGQTQYVLTKVSYRKENANGTVAKTPFKDLPKGVQANLYNNALTISGMDALGEAYRFIRKINQQEKDGVYVKWIALDRDENSFEIMVVDYGSYSMIGILNQKTKDFTLYQTL